jgi:hypothetical protein
LQQIFQFHFPPILQKNHVFHHTTPTNAGNEALSVSKPNRTIFAARHQPSQRDFIPKIDLVMSTRSPANSEIGQEITSGLVPLKLDEYGNDIYDERNLCYFQRRSNKARLDREIER